MRFGAVRLTLFLTVPGGSAESGSQRTPDHRLTPYSSSIKYPAFAWFVNLPARPGLTLRT